MKIDTAQALKHLTMLGYSPSEPVFFREFPPKQGQGTARGFKRGMSEIEKLTQNPQKGLYFVVNGGGQTDKEVKECKAFFAEWDDRPIAEQLIVWKEKGFLEPSLMVQTRKSVHCYWILKTSVSVDKWKPVQAQLLDYLDADRSLKNPSRVLRLAGGWHIKEGEEPLQVKIIHEGEKYTFYDIFAVYNEPLPLIPNNPTEKVTLPSSVGLSSPIPLILCLPKYQRENIERGCTQGSRNQTGFGLVKDLVSTERWLIQQGIPFTDSARLLFTDYCQRCNQDDWSQPEWERIFQSGEKAATIPPLSDEMLQNCIKGWEKRNGSANINNNVNNKVNVNASNNVNNNKYHNSHSDIISVYGGTKQLNSKELLFFLKENLGEKLSFDNLRNEIHLDGKPLKLEQDIKFWFVENLNETASKDDLFDCLTYLAKQNSFNPVEEYFKQVSSQSERVDIKNLATRYLGQSSRIFNRMFELWIIQCVARVMSPGCQADATLILQGDQGKYKSTAFRVLGGEWFDDSVKDIESKDSLMTIHTAWILELSELDRITGKKEAGAIKHWLTQRKDSFRKPYAREVDPNNLRRCCFCGTVNPSRFLVDDENRRFWIIPLAENLAAIDIKLLESERDGIWASAYDAYQAGQTWDATEAEKAEIRQLNKGFEDLDLWHDIIENWIEDKDMVSSFEILTELFKLDPGLIKRADDMRVTKTLNRLGWTKEKRMMIDDKYRRVRLNPIYLGKVGKVGNINLNQHLQPNQPTNQPVEVGSSNGKDVPSNDVLIQPTYQPLKTNLPTSETTQSIDVHQSNQPYQQLSNFPRENEENLTTKGSLKALSVKQPWAYHIFYSGKDVENRSQTIPSKMVGYWVAIHSSLTIDETATLPDVELITGHIIGMVRFSGCSYGHESPWSCPGQYQWVIAEKLILPTPIPCKKALGLWDVPDHELRLIEEQTPIIVQK